MLEPLIITATLPIHFILILYHLWNKYYIVLLYFYLYTYYCRLCKTNIIFSIHNISLSKNLYSYGTRQPTYVDDMICPIANNFILFWYHFFWSLFARHMQFRRYGVNIVLCVNLCFCAARMVREGGGELIAAGSCKNVDGHFLVIRIFALIRSNSVRISFWILLQIKIWLLSNEKLFPKTYSFLFYLFFHTINIIKIKLYSK